MQKAELQKYAKLLNETSLKWITDDSGHSDVNWSLHAGGDISEGQVYKAHIAKYGTVWKAQVILDCPAEMAYRETILKRRTDYFPSLSMNHLLESGEDWDLVYQVAQGQSGISDRDFYTIQFRRELPGGVYVQTACSLEEIPKYNFKPPAKKVRGENLPGGMSWKQLPNPNQCLWTYIYNVDLKGFIPKTLINLVVSNFLLQFATSAREFAYEISKAMEPRLSGAETFKENQHEHATHHGKKHHHENHRERGSMVEP